MKKAIHHVLVCMAILYSYGIHDTAVRLSTETVFMSTADCNHCNVWVIMMKKCLHTERGRRRTRRGDIFTSIRRRFSKTRSRSANQDGVEDTSLNREQGASRDRDFRAVSVDRESLASRHFAGILGHNSARSSASELSALSGHSTSTFIHENSTLVIECIENRIRK